MLNEFNNKDRKIFTIAGIVFLLMMSLTLTEDWISYFGPSVEKDLEPIGSVTNSQNDVRRRYKIDFSWASLKNESTVYQGDTIFTGDKSSTVIKTATGEEIIVAPNSLVVINTSKDSISIDIGFGSIEGNLPTGKKIVISSNNKITELAGDNAKIRVDAGGGDSLVLDVLQGQVQVQDGGKKTTLNQFDLAELTSDGSLRDKETKNVQLLAPLREQRFRFTEDRAVEFKWQTLRDLKRSFLKVATDPEFKNLVLRTPVQDGSYVGYNFPKDKQLYWTVVGEGLNSEVSEFWLLGIDAPTPIQPQQGKHFYYNPDLQEGPMGARVTLGWANGSPSRRYEVQVARSVDFTAALQTFVSDDTQFTTPLLSGGTYYWRVRGMEFPDSRWSREFTFKIGPEPSKFIVPPAPTGNEEFLLLTKLHSIPQVEFAKLTAKGFLEYVSNPVVIDWSKVNGATAYELQIASDKAFRNLLVNRQLSGTSYRWKDAQPGLYHWRVRSVNEGDYKSKYTRTETIAVKVAPPPAVSQALVEEEVTERELLFLPVNLPVEIAWMPTIFSQQYEVLFSENIRFDKAVRFVTKQASRKVRIPKVGVYFWKVRSLDSNGRAVSQFSESRTLEFRRNYRDPRLSENLLTVTPKMNDALLLVGNGNSDILFEWTRPFDNAEYELQIAADPKFEKIVHQTRTKKTLYELEKPLSIQDVYWRVRAHKPTGYTNWTAVGKFFLSYEQTPYEADTFEKLQVAKLKAKERQKKVLAALKRRLSKLRMPAGATDVKLDTPELLKPEPVMILSGNYDPKMTSRALAKQSVPEFQKQVSNFPRLEWKPVLAADRYFVEIAEDAEFKNLLLKQPTYETYYLWETPKPGRFFYRVQAYNERYTRSDYSKSESIQLQVSRPETKSPESVVELMNAPREMWPLPSPFDLKWTPRIFAKNYEFEFSETPTFAVSKVFLTDRASKEVQVSKAGRFFWRVRPVNEAGVGISRWSDTFSVEVSQAMRSPASEDGTDGLYPIQRTIIQVGKGVLDLAFYLAGQFSEQRVIEVSKTAGFENILTATVANDRKATLSINDDVPDGKLYWRVRDNSLRGPASVKSKVYEFSFKRELEPYRSDK